MIRKTQGIMNEGEDSKNSVSEVLSVGAIYLMYIKVSPKWLANLKMAIIKQNTMHVYCLMYIIHVH